MQSVIVSDFGVMLGKTSERLVVRGPRPRLDLVEGGPQLSLPLDLPPRPLLRPVTCDGVKVPEAPLRRPRSRNGEAPAALLGRAVSRGSRPLAGGGTLLPIWLALSLQW